MTNNIILILLLVCIGSLFVFADTEYIETDCPDKCICRRINENGSSLRVKCGGSPQSKITSIKEINFDRKKFDIVQL